MDLYLGVAVTLMFVFGCFLIVLSLREQSEKRKRQRIWTSVKPGRQKARHYESQWKSRTNP